MAVFVPRRRAGLLAFAVGAALCVCAAGADDPKPKGDRYAFLVGCSTYDAKELRPLKYPRDDMNAFADVLKQSGWRDDNVVLMHDGRPRRFQPEAKKIRQELQLLLAGLAADDLVVVALSGHGVQYKGDKASYFCPIDARLDDKATLLPLEEVYDLLDKCPAGRKLLLVDAARDDPLSDLGKKGPVRMDLESVTRPPPDAPRGIAALFSCSEGQASREDPDLGHSVFFHFVLDGWQGAASQEGPVTLDDLTAYVRKQTEDHAKKKLGTAQTPLWKGDASGVWVLSEAGGPSAAAVDAAVEDVKRLGGTVERDEKQAGRPVVRVSLYPANEEVNDDDLAPLRAFPRLGALDLTNAYITDAGMKELARLKSLRTLRLNSEKITAAGLKELQALKNLQELDLSGAESVTDEGAKQIAGVRSLQALNLLFTKVTDAGLKDLAGMPNLRELAVGPSGDTDNVTAAGLKELGRLQALEKLNLTMTRVTAAGMKELGALKGLRGLDLELTGVTDQDLQELEGMKGLRRVNLRGTPVTDAGMKHLAGLKGLQELYLTATWVTDAWLREVAGLDDLRTLDLGFDAVTDGGLKQVSRLKRLNTLDLTATDVTDDGLKELVGLEGLRWLSLDMTKATDAGLKRVAALKALEELRLGGIDVTDAGLKNLAGLKSLRRLVLRGTKATDAGAAELQQALPDVTIERGASSWSPFWVRRDRKGS